MNVFRVVGGAGSIHSGVLVISLIVVVPCLVGHLRRPGREGAGIRGSNGRPVHFFVVQLPGRGHSSCVTVTSDASCLGFLGRGGSVVAARRLRGGQLRAEDAVAVIGHGRRPKRNRGLRRVSAGTRRHGHRACHRHMHGGRARVHIRIQRLRVSAGSADVPAPASSPAPRLAWLPPRPQRIGTQTHTAPRFVPACQTPKQQPKHGYGHHHHNHQTFTTGVAP